MATMNELAERLLLRFKGVPNFTINDAQELVQDAMQAHGYAPNDDVPSDKENLILFYSQTNGAWQIAFSVAHYFKYQDGEEAVDKSMLADNYRRLAKDLQDEYDKERARITGAGFYVAARIDRPNTTPPTGKSGRLSRWYYG